MKYQPFIASYRKDFEWLEFLLRSIDVRSRGFERPVVCVPPDQADEARARFPGAIVTLQDEVPDGVTPWRRFLAAQVAMMECDIHCPDADFVWLFGSDCFVRGPLYPETGMFSGRPVMPFSMYADIGPGPDWWKAGTEAALQFPSVEREFMRRLPLVYPRVLYPAVRKHIEHAHGMSFKGYVYSTADAKNFSESNVLGAYAWEYRRHLFEWVNLGVGNNAQRFGMPVIQFWSHGGLDLPCDQHHALHGQIPREFMTRELSTP